MNGSLDFESVYEALKEQDRQIERLYESARRIEEAAQKTERAAEAMIVATALAEAYFRGKPDFED